MSGSILTINAGSSSIKFAFYQTDTRISYGALNFLDCNHAQLSFFQSEGNQRIEKKFTAPDENALLLIFLEWLEKQNVFHSIIAIGHRLVHGMKHHAPQVLTSELLKELHEIELYAPEHLPRELTLIKEFTKHHPHLLQIACFDTAFHRTIPSVAKLLPIPRRYQDQGMERYGFHGLSYTYLMEELGNLAGRETAQGRVILAHLGNGASLAAVHKGQSRDTSMSFSPASGLVMGTRSGDLDPGLAIFLEKKEKKTSQQFYRMINHESGLLGISETSSNMSELLKIELQDSRAAEAIALFCYQVKKWIGAYAAALGGLDTLVFSGGIGEHASVIRTRICEGLQFLGLSLEENLNKNNNTLVSSPESRIKVYVIPTNEELMIARSVNSFLKNDDK